MAWNHGRRRLALFIGHDAWRQSACASQPALTGVVLCRRVVVHRKPDQAHAGITRSSRPPKSWTEIVFSDESVHRARAWRATSSFISVAFDPKSARNRIVVSGGGGQIRVETANDTEAEVAIPGAKVRVIAAGAVLQAAPPSWVSMLGGREVVVWQTLTSRHPPACGLLRGARRVRTSARQSEPTTSRPIDPASVCRLPLVHRRAHARAISTVETHSAGRDAAGHRPTGPVTRGGGVRGSLNDASQPGLAGPVGRSH